MNDRPGEVVKKVIPFAQVPLSQTGKDNIPPAPAPAPAPRQDNPYAPKVKELRHDGDPVDRSGQAIVALLQEAAETANVNCDRAMDLAHKLSIQLRAAEERVRELEREMHHYQDRAQRAEKWLVRIYNDIEQRFFENNQKPSSQQPR